MWQSKEIIGNRLSYGDTLQSFSLDGLQPLHAVVAEGLESIKPFLLTENLIKILVNFTR